MTVDISTLPYFHYPNESSRLTHFIYLFYGLTDGGTVASGKLTVKNVNAVNVTPYELFCFNNDPMSESAAKLHPAKWIKLHVSLFHRVTWRTENF